MLTQRILINALQNGTRDRKMKILAALEVLQTACVGDSDAWDAVMKLIDTVEWAGKMSKADKARAEEAYKKAYGQLSDVVMDY
jgi:hypothetical protein